MKNLKYCLLIIISLQVNVYGNFLPGSNNVTLTENLFFHEQGDQITLDAGDNQKITLPTTSTILEGNGYSNDGVRYKWVRLSGPMDVRIADPSKLKTQISDLQEEGVYIFELSASYKNEFMESDRVSITVKPRPQPNRVPTANAGSDKTIRLPENSITLSGSGADPDGRITGYTWRRISGPNQPSIISPGDRRTRINGLVEGEYTFQLTVRDDRGGTDSDRVKVTVQRAPPPPNQSPTANAGTDKAIRLPTNNVLLTGSGSDPDGSIEQYSWNRISGPNQPNFASPEDRRTRISGLVEGEYTFQLTVRDDRGGTDSDRVKVTVQRAPLPPNQAPTANAGSDLIIRLPENNVVLLGSGTDPDGSIAGYNWRKVSGPSQFSTSSSTNRRLEVSELVRGTYIFLLTVRDDRGASDSDNVRITVLRAQPQNQNQSPIANAGSDQITFLPTNRVVLSGSGSDADGTIDSYQWDKISGPSSHTIDAPSSPQTAVRDLEEGTYRFRLTVIDNESAVDSDFVSVIVENRVTAFQVSAGPDQSITLPKDNVFLNGSEGNLSNIQYRWQKLSGPDQFEIVSPTQARTQVRNLTEGVYEFELSATHSEGSSSDSVKIIVEPKEVAWLLWLFICALGIVGVSTAYYFLVLIPLPRKVLVFFMHKDEEQLVRELMPNSRKTKNYAVGRCDSRKIKKMKEEGLAFHILNTNDLYINTPGQTRSMKNKSKKGKPKFEDAVLMPKPGRKLRNVALEKKKSKNELRKEANDFPTFYLISLDEPMLPRYKKNLEKAGVEIIKHVPDDNYTVLIKNKDQLNKLNGKGFDFIRHKQHYTSYDRGLTIREEHRKKAAESGENIFLDIIVHREEDMTKVTKFIKGLDVEIVQSYKNRIRISAPAKLVKELNLSDNKYIQAIYEYIPYILHNDVARKLVKLDEVETGKSIISETGEGEIIAVADTGIDRNHPDLKSRIIDAVSWGRRANNDTSDSHGHGTHVTGTIVGDGTASNGKIKGIAPGAKVFFQSIMDEDETLVSFDMLLLEILNQAYQKGARIHNNSWGSATESRYTYDTTTVDEFIYNNPEMLVVLSAGNEGAYNTDDPSEKGFVGFGSICSPATNKNGLTVGASRHERSKGGYSTSLYGAIWPEKFPYPPTSAETISGNVEELAAFSSRGQSEDDRMKPDIVAPGTDVLSTKSELAPLRNFHGGFPGHKNSYAFLGGTSMAAPIISGAAALVREYYKKKRNCAKMSAALIKATLINGTVKLTGNSANYMGDFIPNPNQGFGMLDMSMTIPNESNPFQLVFTDSLQDSSVLLHEGGEAYTLRIHLKEKSWIRFCMAYTDRPLSGIQNDLDLIIDFNETRRKWSGNIGIQGGSRFGKRKEDRKNNMEIVRIPHAQPGLYTVKVIAHNLLLKNKDKGQGFALVITTSDMSAKFENKEEENV